VVVGDQGAQGRLTGLVVVPDRSGQRQQPLQDPDRHALVGLAHLLGQPSQVLDDPD
jgi:hypothetical protein